MVKPRGIFPMILKHAWTWPRDAMALASITGVFGLIGFSGKAAPEAIAVRREGRIGSSSSGVDMPVSAQVALDGR